MQVKLVIKRIPFTLVYREDFISRPFHFTPHLIRDRNLRDTEKINELALSLTRVRELYNNIMNLVSGVPSIKYVEMEHSITLTDEELRQLITNANKLGIRLRWYVEILPLVSEEEFKTLQQRAKRTPAPKLISEVLRNHGLR